MKPEVLAAALAPVVRDYVTKALEAQAETMRARLNDLEFRHEQQRLTNETLQATVNTLQARLGEFETAVVPMPGDRDPRGGIGGRGNRQSAAVRGARAPPRPAGLLGGRPRRVPRTLARRLAGVEVRGACAARGVAQGVDRFARLSAARTQSAIGTRASRASA